MKKNIIILRNFITDLWFYTLNKFIDFKLWFNNVYYLSLITKIFAKIVMYLKDNHLRNRSEFIL